MTSTPVITRGTVINLDYGTEVALQAIVVEDPDPVVGEAEITTVQAHDGTKYTTPGDTGDNTLALNLLQSLEEFDKIMDYAYGAPTVVGTKKTWDLSSASGVSGTISATSPITSGEQFVWRLMNAKSLSVTPQFPIGDFFRVQMSIVGDNWEADHETGL